MQIAEKPLTPLSQLQLSPEERKIIGWLKTTTWETMPAEHGIVRYKTKVPEFYNGARLYNMQGGGTRGPFSPVELLIKKLNLQGALTKQDLYPLQGHGSVRFLIFKKADLDNLGVGKAEEDEE